MDDKKKITAAVSAVMAYIRSEEDAIMQLSMLAASAPPKPAPPVIPLKLWGINGRQTQMQMRSLMQMRAFK